MITFLMWSLLLLSTQTIYSMHAIDQRHTEWLNGRIKLHEQRELNKAMIYWLSIKNHQSLRKTLEQGADPHFMEEEKDIFVAITEQRPLNKALRNKDFESAKILLEFGANPLLRDRKDERIREDTFFDVENGIVLSKKQKKLTELLHCCVFEPDLADEWYIYTSSYYFHALWCLKQLHFPRDLRPIIIKQLTGYAHTISYCEQYKFSNLPTSAVHHENLEILLLRATIRQIDLILRRYVRNSPKAFNEVMTMQIIEEAVRQRVRKQKLLLNGQVPVNLNDNNCVIL